ncbi:MAG: biosynthetic-type acetolactate synthase large subunit [Eubacteriales bacterium]
MNGAAIIVNTLIEQGVDTVFGYPGGMVINIYDELYKSSSKIKHYLSCHEQGAAHAADGYARTTGKTGVVIATSGPGATNLITGIATAYLDSTPMVFITGNVPCGLIGRDSFQEVDIFGITMPITKHNYIVKDITKLADTIRQAFKIANEGRPGPVLIDVPKDIQVTEYDYKEAKKYEASHSKVIDLSMMDEATKIIEKAKKPFIYIGGGVVMSDAGEEIKALAEKIDAPVGSSMMGLTAISNSLPEFLGMTGMHGKYGASRAMAESDLIIAVGTRFSDRATGNTKEYAKGRKIIHIDIDPAEIGKNVPAYVSLVGDVKEVLDKLLAAIKKQTRKEWKEEVAKIKNSYENTVCMPKNELNPQCLIETVRGMTNDDTIIVTDVGQHQMWVAQYYRFEKPRTFITSGGLGTMGFGLGAAIGACIGSDKKRTVLFTGDGSFHMNFIELATAVTNKLPIVVIVLNNRVLGMVRQWQDIFFGSRYSNTVIDRKTDFAEVANAMGAKGIHLNDFTKLKDVLKEAFDQNGPVVIDATIDKDEKVLPMIIPGGTIKDILLRR